MKAIRVHTPGGPEALKLRGRARARAGGRPGRRQAGSERRQLHRRVLPHRRLQGGRCRSPSASKGAGTVTAVGPGVTDVKVGDRVAWTGVPGAYAQMSAVPADRLVKLPDGLTFKDGAAAMLQGLTAHYLVTSTLSAQEGRHLPGPGRGGRHGPAALPDGEDAGRHRDRHRVHRGEGRARQGGGRRPRHPLHQAGLRARGEADHRTARRPRGL